MTLRSLENVRFSRLLKNFCGKKFFFKVLFLKFFLSHAVMIKATIKNGFQVYSAKPYISSPVRKFNRIFPEGVHTILRIRRT